MSKPSKSSLRIVLVDPLGDVMFSGDSIIAPTEEADEAPAAPVVAQVAPPAPEPRRSTPSGVYRAVDLRAVRRLQAAWSADDDAPPSSRAA